MHVLITVDTEEEWDWNGAYAVRAPAVSNIANLPWFQSLCERHGLRPTYFTNHPVLADPVARETMAALAERPGTEIGLHIHPWNTPPLAGVDQPSSAETFLANLPEDLIRRKLDSVHAALAGIGVRGTSFRGGRYSSSAQIRRHLQALGYRADSSIVPYTTWMDEGSPDYRARGLLPTRTEPGAPGEPALWEIPLTRAFTRPRFDLWARGFTRIERSPLLSRMHLIGIAARLGIVRRFWLNFEVRNQPEWFAPIRLLQRQGVPHICFCVHSSSLVPGPGPYNRDAGDDERIRTRIERVFEWLAAQPDLVPATVTELADHLEQTREDHRHQPA
jgi:hypothetical protein